VNAELFVARARQGRRHFSLSYSVAILGANCAVWKSFALDTAMTLLCRSEEAFPADAQLAALLEDAGKALCKVYDYLNQRSEQLL
jgi:hypothetical protein